jgi:hypothetical protein
MNIKAGPRESQAQVSGAPYSENNLFFPFLNPSSVIAPQNYLSPAAKNEYPNTF